MSAAIPPGFQHAELDWDENGQPQSRRYGDVYFSRGSGMAETNHVFLQPNRLAERFAALQAGERLVIGETGFGTGLSFLCAWALFERTAPANSALHFVSVEKHPLTRDDLRRALTLWPELQLQARQLLDQYVAINPGFQQFRFGQVTLTLLVGDALDRLKDLNAQVDAWFLDGFAPPKNPDMWQPELFEQVARLSAPGATLATFSSAGSVRRALKETGFEIKRIPGFGQKWENLQGHLAASPKTLESPWFARPSYKPTQRKALIIGAGLAGCASAASLAARGWQVTLLERHDDVAQEGSGNPQGVLYLKLSAHGTALSQLVASGFGYTRRLLQNLQQGQDWDACGVLQLAFDNKESARQAALSDAFPPSLLRAVQREEAEQLAGVALDHGGLFYPDAGWAHPPALCRWLIAHPAIELLLHRHPVELRRAGEQWQALIGDELLAEAPVVILAGAADAARFSQSAWLPLKRIRGQITALTVTERSSALRTVLCAKGYVAPPREGQHTLGASFNFAETDPAPSAAEHDSNLEMLAEISADLHQRLEADTVDIDQLHGRVAFRCTSPDYLPIIGALANPARFAEAYAVLAKDARQVPDTPCPWLDGLYVNTAHGSRGLITAPLAGELLAAWLNDEPLPVPRAIAEACHPNRFLLRKLIRRID
ncbi:bifunctional tRNA (5-methylaminomethyl-2-thiouridine)(34)-methyltransferase MnmD/FAD-dependent 5-carboxymethylaminomethyl-2-thiouridine(34) oxidoreductase MnmC [Stutzerimonas zhaodongensis]|jgi:tRNA 5-methylaminomethyl-2-thiouridine biosynthesis bifunctional protein|uniref:bifunctional tRNA (5-methylaminomethyl-2-thiouridine)(34)-methyltransferase MnmD/FAD-dependent 5-carboxymethylaminomethyl-2-thiouridine(34) oxidoreductase MnmC n=1 Tax=Stutzerimonas zhaodongensis TaxID=1176257 RepID=UPI001F4DDC81|nr:bifunctional tRNA (5-methylaminomethyl-2-thiouridine)(34)-methyltransferase MnmD/FAD-dependent 5-carboxymethylaminomethyl-2-thiouridine(34) oxidoreductase MnmC [Stutzerimonas zhaodongensis]UNG20448.1 bifunctional tRNA (5-methylaminomethyl-2-thiouridine)(34)-methyltransferase MnmD/FAD-dependent 5-carboxymethylaminomethyl-2-thiouridine(34) oxidoreductase MnmC [Stutzerimonas zhaodongensis]